MVPTSSSSSMVGFDARRAARDARVRPWLTGSVFRRPSPPSGVKSEDAPKLSSTTTVTPPPASASPSRIPVRCKTEKVLVKEKSTVPAQSSTVTGKQPSKIPLPARPKVQAATPSAASHEQPRTGKPLVVKTSSVVRKVGIIGKASQKSQFPRESIRGSINPKPIRVHREDIPVRPILKHRAKPSEPTELQPYSTTGHGSDIPNLARKKRVSFLSELCKYSEKKPWDGALYTPSICRHCGMAPGHKMWCKTVALEEKYYSLDGVEWLEEQMSKGYDYKAMSGGRFSNGRDTSDPFTDDWPDLIE